MAAVELDDQMHCKLHPKARINDVKLVVPEDVPLELPELQVALTKQYKALRVRRIIIAVLAIVIIVVLCYLTNT
jgi:hypothetical protein